MFENYECILETKPLCFDVYTLFMPMDLGISCECKLTTYCQVYGYKMSLQTV